MPNSVAEATKAGVDKMDVYTEVFTEFESKSRELGRHDAYGRREGKSGIERIVFANW
jgi:hypothetical protein